MHVSSRLCFGRLINLPKMHILLQSSQLANLTTHIAQSRFDISFLLLVSVHTVLPRPLPCLVQVPSGAASMTASMTEATSLAMRVLVHNNSLVMDVRRILTDPTL